MSAPTAAPRETIPVHVTGVDDDDLTWVSFEYGGRRHRFSVQGTEAPYDVQYLHDFGLRGNERQAWFSIAPEHAATPSRFEQGLYPQLVRVHEAELDRRRAATPA